MRDTDEIFLIHARRCKRCGGLLTSKQAVEDGYGHVCKMKTQAEREARKGYPGQISMEDFFKVVDGNADEIKGERSEPVASEVYGANETPGRIRSARGEDKKGEN